MQKDSAKAEHAFSSFYCCLISPYISSLIGQVLQNKK
jgi:hypothetical protein